MRKPYAEFGSEVSSFELRISQIAEARKQPTRRVLRSDRDMTIRANDWRRSLARKELRAVAIQTRRVFWEISLRISFQFFEGTL